MRHLLDLLILAGGVAACVGPPPPRADIELAVYAAVLDSLVSGAPARRLLLESMTTDPLLFLSRWDSSASGDTARTRLASETQRGLEGQEIEPALAADFV